MLSKIVNYIKTNASIIRNRIKWFFIFKPFTDKEYFIDKIKGVKQKLCSHSWEYPYDEDHGTDPTKRICINCKLQQYVVYRRYGNIRYEWKNK